MLRSDGMVGMTTSSAGSHPSVTGVGLALAIVAGFVPAFLIMARSSRRRRAGPHHGSSRELHDGPSLGMT